MHNGVARLVVGMSAVAIASTLLTGCSEPVSAQPPPSTTAAPTSTPTPTAAASPSPSTGPIGTVVRSVRIALPASSDGATADATVFYAAGPGSGGGGSWAMQRVDLATGAVTRRALTLPFLRFLSVGPDGLYVSTSVIDKYGSKPDTLLRLDPRTLRTLDSRRVDDGAIWNGAVRVASTASVLAEVDGGGSVRLLDPRTLATRRSTRLLSKSDLQAGDDIESPTVFGGRLWVLAKSELVALDLTTLAVTSRVTLPTGYGAIVATRHGLELVGDGLAQVTAGGQVRPQPTRPGDDAGSNHAVAIGDDVLQQPNATPPVLWLRGPTGALIRSAPLQPDTGQLLAGSGTTAWVEGYPGATGDLTAVSIR